MNIRKPRLSIGLPVYNGEKYLEATLISLGKQTLQDYELIISDNASTDRTEEICRTYAAQDRRVRYFRNAKNIGASPNWYRVFDLSSSDYFASVAHDDLYAPEYMQKCAEVLDCQPATVLCYSKTGVIDEMGNLVGRYEAQVDTSSPSVSQRIYNVVMIDYLCIQLYGVMRSSALRATKVYSGYYGCDRNTLFELCLLGKLVERPEQMFLHRLYPGALGIAMNSGKSVDELLVLDPATNWRYRSTAFTIYTNYFLSVSRLIKSPGERLKCYSQLVRIVSNKSTARIKGLAGNLGKS